jgi:hypothetical protein
MANYYQAQQIGHTPQMAFPQRPATVPQSHISLHVPPSSQHLPSHSSSAQLISIQSVIPHGMSLVEATNDEKVPQAPLELFKRATLTKLMP